VFANCIDRFRALFLSILLLSCFVLPAMAGPFEDSVAKFANDEFSDTEDAVGEIASSGNPLASPIISALQDGRLSADPDSKKVFITQPDGKIIDAATGAAVDKLPDNAAAVRLNNRLRRPHRGCRGRRPDTDVVGPGEAFVCRAIGAQEPRREHAADGRQRARQGDQ
jgi:urea transport system permease protein